MAGKSVLVVDTPKTCKECPCQMMLVCVPADEDIDEYINPSKTKPDWCPLRPLPHKKMPKQDEAFPQDMRLIDRWRGWDACIDEIIGETE